MCGIYELRPLDEIEYVSLLKDCLTFVNTKLKHSPSLLMKYCKIEKTFLLFKMIVQLLNVFGKEEITIENARRVHHYYFT